MFKETKTILQSAEEKLSQYSLQEVYGIIYDNLGQICHWLNEIPEAQTYYQKALIVFKNLGLKEQAGDTCLNISSDYHNAQEFSTAKEWIQKALDYYNDCIQPKNKKIAVVRLQLLKKQKKDDLLNS